MTTAHLGHIQLAGQRDRLIELWILGWRFTAAALVLLLALFFASQRTVSSFHSFALVTSAILYSSFYYFLATRLTPPSRLSLSVLDVSAMALLLVAAAGDDRYVLIMAINAVSGLLIGSASSISRSFVLASVLTVAYFAANYISGLSPMRLLLQPNNVGVVFLFSFFGAGFFGFSSVLRALSALELDKHLADLRKSYRRRLHDDLGNTLCGLHFKMQTLKNTTSQEACETMEFLIAGYERAATVLKNIVGGMQERVDESLLIALARVKERLEQENGLEVEIVSESPEVHFAPEVRREIIAILYEAAMNSYKHSGSKSITIRCWKDKRRSSFSLTDSGAGFTPEVLEQKQVTGRKGIAGMKERAHLIGGNLVIDGSPGAGTTVIFSLPSPSWLSAEKLWNIRQTQKLYSIAVFLKPMTLILILIQAIITLHTDSFTSNLAMTCVLVLLVANALTWLAFRRQIHGWVRNSYVPLTLEVLSLAAIISIATSYDLPTYVGSYPFVSFIIFGILLGSSRNLLLALVFLLAIIPSHFLQLVPHPSRTLALRIEDYLIFVMSLFFCAIVVGLAGDYVKQLERQRNAAISRTLERKHEEITADAHRRLWSIAAGLKSEIQSIAHRLPEIAQEDINRLESQSRELKAKLRAMLNSLDEG